MKKRVILYASYHHNNTQKVVQSLAPIINADVFDVLHADDIDICQYEVIVIASGIYFQTIHQKLLDLIKSNCFVNKKVIVLYTCGIRYKSYVKNVQKMIVDQGGKYLGEAYCRGYDTFGALQKIGGIAKNHPNNNDIQKVCHKVAKLLSISKNKS